MMAPDLIEVLARVQEEIGAQLEVLDRQGGVYAAEVLHLADAPHRVNPPGGPPAMRPELAKMIRELVMDELVAMGPQRMPVSWR